ncbi:hypothetical protein [Pseudovibrio exalbescens]|uniref:hypothetical protein n=1 Tax=Pseudovibrio exalbescens TaxID=197461 RepID=UPI0011AFBAD1|nr:hypothetical protein [Pseudovibrio exalbescens]
MKPAKLASPRVSSRTSAAPIRDPEQQSPAGAAEAHLDPGSLAGMTAAKKKVRGCALMKPTPRSTPPLSCRTLIRHPESQSPKGTAKARLDPGSLAGVTVLGYRTG